MLFKNLISSKIALSAIFVMLIFANYAGAQEMVDLDFGEFNKKDWIKVRDPSVKEMGRFLKKEGYIQNFVKKEHIGKHSLESGHALRLLKDFSFYNGRIETELMLMGKAAPSIYFRTQINGDVHSDTYNLVVFNFSSPSNKYYYGLNLWKWKEKWPEGVNPVSNHWVKLASWAFPVNLNKRIKIAVETKGPYIKVFFNNQLKGTVYDSNPLEEGHIGICSCEGVNKFYNCKVKKQ